MKTRTKQVIAIALIALLGGSVIYTGCEQDPVKPPKPTKPDTPKVVVPVPDFSGDTAFAYIKRQVDFGPRVPNSQEHQACGDWLIAQLKSYGATVTTQEAPLKARDGSSFNLRNIIAQFQPEKKDRILLCAHYDTRPIADKDPNPAMRNKAIDGANDGGSGVGVLLEIARLIHITPTNVGIDIILFDAEDNGLPENVPQGMEVKNPGYPTSWCIGSQYWGKNRHAANYNPRFGILLDMVGAADAEFNKEETSMSYAADVMNKVWQTADILGYGSYFQDRQVAGVTDDHSFVNMAGIRCIDIIDTRPEVAAMGLGEYQFGSYHHTHKDNIDIIDKSTLKAVGQTVLQVIYNP